MGNIALQKIEKWYGDSQVIKGIDLEIKEGELIIFVGPSGCGKSTLLRMIAGVEEVSRGSILIGDKDVTGQLPATRGLAMVFQSYALYPHMSVAENMGFSLKTSGTDAKAIKSKVDAASQALKLEPLMERRPKDLSGGQRQRVAIGRAIVRDPIAFLFDEPLSNLDAALRVEMRHEIARLHQVLKRTMVYVTHDQVEAMTLADRIVVMQGGVIEQVGTPRQLYELPQNTFVAQFIGSPKMNLINGETVGSIFTANDIAVIEAPTGACHLGIRPEHISVCEEGAGMVDGIVEVVEYVGCDVYIFINTKVAGVLNIRCSPEHDFQLGQTIGMIFAQSHCHFFDTNGQRITANG